MYGMLLAELAVFRHFKSVRIVLFILHRIIVPLFAFRASKRDLRAHFLSSGLLFLGNLKKALSAFYQRCFYMIPLNPVVVKISAKFFRASKVKI